MIVYSELSSLCRDLGFTARELYAASRNTDRLYRKAVLPKAGGGVRELSVPSPLLKAIQTAVYEKLLSQEPVSRYACAYRPGGGIKRCAAPHVGRGQVLTLDIRRFFDSAIYPLIKEKVFTPKRYSEPNRVLLSMLCTYRDALPQGAPSSPAISNILLYGFDEAVGAYCRERDIRYTRYCDDMAFSGLFDARELTAFVESELKKLGFFLNRKKTRLARQGQRQAVTG
ncbi:MAG: RNA-directed DNA polymerase, partial [Clostridia bacterium]|nr:RNA-directed DNA polymerase [Clostridia bacterium]